VGIVKTNRMKSNRFLKNIALAVVLILFVPLTVSAQLMNEGTFKLGRLFGLIDNFYVDSVNMK
jgi:hypothetical protein